MSWISLGHLGSSRAPLSCNNILVCWHYFFIFLLQTKPALIRRKTLYMLHQLGAIRAVTKHFTFKEFLLYFHSIKNATFSKGDCNTVLQTSSAKRRYPSVFQNFPKFQNFLCIFHSSLVFCQEEKINNSYVTMLLTQKYWIQFLALVFFALFSWFIPTLTFNLLHILSLDLPWNDPCFLLWASVHWGPFAWSYISELLKMGTSIKMGTFITNSAKAPDSCFLAPFLKEQCQKEKKKKINKISYISQEQHQAEPIHKML